MCPAARDSVRATRARPSPPPTQSPSPPPIQSPSPPAIQPPSPPPIQPPSPPPPRANTCAAAAAGPRSNVAAHDGSAPLSSRTDSLERPRAHVGPPSPNHAGSQSACVASPTPRSVSARMSRRSRSTQSNSADGGAGDAGAGGPQLARTAARAATNAPARAAAAPARVAIAESADSQCPPPAVPRCSSQRMISNCSAVSLGCEFAQWGAQPGMHIAMSAREYLTYLQVSRMSAHTGMHTAKTKSNQIKSNQMYLLSHGEPMGRTCSARATRIARSAPSVRPDAATAAAGQSAIDAAAREAQSARGDTKFTCTIGCVSPRKPNQK